MIYIFPDHLKMGSAKLFEGTGERGLYLLTNATNLESYRKAPLYQIDLPKMVMDGAEIKHNLTFLTDYITGDKNEFIQKNINELTTLNLSGFALEKPAYVPTISENYTQYIDDTNRFIAHAGGVIDGYVYTNSLEALDENYKKGFRLFELDIVKTIDNQYVAVHKWSEWAAMIGYDTVDVRVTHEKFLRHKIYGKYTPLDMKRINGWFQDHKDAILITDKINEPKQFSEAFIDKERLMMELFSWEAVKEGIKAKIKSSMPSNRLIKDLKDVNRLKKMGITEVAINRRLVERNLDLLKQLKQNGIRAYSFGTTHEIDKDELYVVKHEMDFFYGIYADEWTFKE